MISTLLCMVYKMFVQTQGFWQGIIYMSFGYESYRNPFILVLAYTENFHKSQPCFLIQTSLCCKEKWIYFSSYTVAPPHLETFEADIHPIDTITFYVFRFPVCSNWGELCQRNCQHSSRLRWLEWILSKVCIEVQNEKRGARIYIFVGIFIQAHYFVSVKMF